MREIIKEIEKFIVAIGVSRKTNAKIEVFFDGPKSKLKKIIELISPTECVQESPNYDSVYPKDGCIKQESVNISGYNREDPLEYIDWEIKVVFETPQEDKAEDIIWI